MASISGLTISVIVPVYNGGADFRRCLHSLATLVPSPAEIIVVANGDTDGSSQLAEKFGARVIRLPSPVGPSRARNVGGRMAQGDVLLFVDADVTVLPDAIGRVAEPFHHNPDVAAVFGSYDDQPGATNFLSQYKNLFNHYVHQTACEEASTFWGACGAVRRQVFLAIGGFDDGWCCMEDVELGYRLRRAGHRIRLCKELQVKHLKRWGCWALLKADILCRALPWTELLLRDRRFVNDLNLSLSNRVSVLLIIGLVGVLVGAAWDSASLVAFPPMALLLLAVNAPLYRFFWRKRGLTFAMRTIPWHWLYYFYGGLAFAVGGVRHLYNKCRDSKPGLPAAVGKWDAEEEGNNDG